MSKLSVSQGHYLKAIYKLSIKAEGARITDIADTLQVSKASACNAVKALEKNGLVFRDVNHQVCLSSEGKKSALVIAENYEFLKTFFIEILGIDEKSAAIQACTLEHVMSNDSIHSLELFCKT
jgi:DtxR family Mn-dependent transcriptional regulator